MRIAEFGMLSDKTGTRMSQPLVIPAKAGIQFLQPMPSMKINS